jgi:hypothetical protein
MIFLPVVKLFYVQRRISCASEKHIGEAAVTPGNRRPKERGNSDARPAPVRRSDLKVNMPAQPELLIGKYFIAPFPHWDGRVEALINDGHYLVRFDVGSDSSPEALAVVALSDMVRAGRENEEEGLAHWLFFDAVEQRARFRAWLDAPEDPNKPRVVPMRRQ